jgi:hypothetical protein
VRSIAKLSIAAIAALLLALPAAAQLTYGVWGDNSAHTPTDGNTYTPGAVSGEIIIDDSGAQPVLTKVRTITNTAQTFGGTSTCCLGTVVTTDLTSVVDVTGLPVTGTGTTSTSINWGTMTGYVQAAFPVSKLRCQTTAGPSCAGCQSCSEVGLAEGLGPMPPLKDSEFNTDPWVFGADRKSLTTSAAEFVSFWLAVWRPVRPRNTSSQSVARSRAD